MSRFFFLYKIPGKNILTWMLVAFLCTPLLSFSQRDSYTDEDSVIMIEQVQQPGSEEEEQQPELVFKKRGEEGFGPDSIQFREIPDSDKMQLKKSPDFWYADGSFRTSRVQSPKTPNDDTWLRSLLWIITIGGFAAFMVVYLAGSNMSIFRRPDVEIAKEPEELLTEDIFSIPYDKEILKAESAANYRLAIRLMFLRLLGNLSNKGIIQYQQDRTNFDYLLELNSTKYYPGFFRLTRDYEYTWYGQLQVSAEQYEYIKKDFQNFEALTR